MSNHVVHSGCAERAFGTAVVSGARRRLILLFADKEATSLVEFLDHQSGVFFQTHETVCGFLVVIVLLVSIASETVIGQHVFDLSSYRILNVFRYAEGG